MYLKSSFLLALSLFFLSPLSLGAKEVKPKAPVVLETLLRDAREAYLAYRFSDAHTLLEKYVTALGRRKQAIPDSVRLLQARVQRAERMYQRAEDLTFESRFRVAKKEWLQKINELRNRLIPEEGVLKGDSLMGQTSYRDKLGRNWIRPSSSSLEWLSMVGKNWEAQPIDMKALNSGAGLIYPYLLEDGTTLLFGRMSDDGLGGYDLYMSRLTGQGDSFYEPTLLGMPYNSPYNDYLLTYDEEKDAGWLVTDRFCPSDSLFVYYAKGRPPFLSGKSRDGVDSLSAEQAFLRASLRDLPSGDTDVAVAISEDEKSGDFYFLLQGNRVYRYWSDFSSKEAVEAFRKAEEQRLALEKKQEALVHLRLQWQQSTEERRKDLRETILMTETQLASEAEKLKALYDAVRKLEGVH